MQVIKKIINKVLFKKSIKKKLNKSKVKYYDPIKLQVIFSINSPVILCANKTDLTGIFNKDLYNKCIIIDNDLLHGVYLEKHNHSSAIIFYLKESSASLDDDVYNDMHTHYIINEFTKFGKQNNLDFVKNIDVVIFLETGNSVLLYLSDHFNKSIDEMLYIKFKNTITQYIKKYQQYINNNDFYIYKETGQEYSHLNFFSYIYYCIIKIISSTLNNEKNLIIHDVGTNNSMFPLLLKYIPENKLLNIDFSKIIASDAHKHWNNVDLDKLISLSKNDIQIEYKKVNIMNNNLVSLGDIVTCIHVLEHFSNLANAYKALVKLWEKTDRLLIINVPLEKKPSKIWGHFYTINSDTLRKWGKSLKNGRMLSDDYKLDSDRTLTDLGFLIIQKL